MELNDLRHKPRVDKMHPTNIAVYRLVAGMTLKDLERESGVSDNLIMELQRGSISPIYRYGGINPIGEVKQPVLKIYRALKQRFQERGINVPFSLESLFPDDFDGEEPLYEEIPLSEVSAREVYSDKSDNPEREYSRMEIRDLIFRRIYELPRPEAYLLLEHYLEGRKLEELGEEAGLTMQRIDQKIKGATISIRKKLMKYPELREYLVGREKSFFEDF